MRPRLRGMTLMELLVVMAILAVLVALSVPGARMLTKGNRVKRASAQLQFDLRRAIARARQGAWVTVTFDPAGGTYSARAVDYDGGVHPLFRSTLPGGVRFGPGTASTTCGTGAAPPGDGVRFFSDPGNDNLLIIGPQGGPITVRGTPVPLPSEVMVTDGRQTGSVVVTLSGMIGTCYWNGNRWLVKN